MNARPVRNWFACSQCGAPTSYRRTGEDGYHHGYCKQCKQVVLLRVDHQEVPPPSSDAARNAYPSPCQ